MINTIRTISVYDYMGNPSPSEMMTLESKRRRNSVLVSLAELVEKYSREIDAEKRQPNPNMRYINARVAKINEMRQTLNAAQKVARR